MSVWPDVWGSFVQILCSQRLGYRSTVEWTGFMAGFVCSASNGCSLSHSLVNSYFGVVLLQRRMRHVERYGVVEVAAAFVRVMFSGWPSMTILRFSDNCSGFSLSALLLLVLLYLCVGSLFYSVFSVISAVLICCCL